MNTNAKLSCRCGKVRACVVDATPANVNRMVCYCDDCQAYLHHLNRSELLDPQGGTDVVQVAPASLRFEQGEDQVVGLRLSPKGLFRWYARCCNTPFGNTLKPSIPFVGLLASSFETPDETFGKPSGAIQGKYATGPVPPEAVKLQLGPLFRVLGKVLGWRLRGKVWPHPFFERETGAPRYPVHTISKAEREALRPLCGPQRAAEAGGSGHEHDAQAS